MSVNVTDSSFQSAVIEESRNRPVLVDFWAEWCGPCKMIGPVLEKLENEYNGRFVLAKLDTDKNPVTAGQFGISSIPAVKLFSGGQVVDEFIGALPEAKIRTFLEKHVPDQAMKALEAESFVDPISAAEKIMAAGQKGEKSGELLWKGALTALSVEQSAPMALKFLAAIPAFGHPRSDGSKAIIAFLESDPGPEDLAAILKILSPGSETEGLGFLLSRVEQSSGEEREKAKNAVLAGFQILGNSGPIVDEYRKKLSRLLF